MKPEFTRRELQMIQYACWSNSEISHELNLAPNTIQTYMDQAQRKLGAKNKREMIVIAVRDHVMSINNFKLT